MLGKSRSGRIPLPAKQILVVSSAARIVFVCVVGARIPAQEFGRVQRLIGKTIIGRFSNRKVRAREFVRARRGPGFFLHRDCRFVKIGFYLHRVRRPSARPEDGRVRRMVASGEFSRQEFSRQEFSRQEFGWARLGAGFRYTEIADSSKTRKKA